MKRFEGASVLVVGGAGFVGSNTVRALLAEGARSVVAIDNLLSAEAWNLPESAALRFIEGSIADDAVLAQVKDEYDYVFHLATFHGNQSSIHDPLADHQNNTLTTLKLYERIKAFRQLKKVVYSAAGCAVAEKTFGKATATEETDTVSLRMDSPYSISKAIGEFYSLYYFDRHALPTVRARFQNVYGPGEILGAGKWRGTPATVWRNVTPTFLYRALKGKELLLENEGVATRDFIYVDDIVEGLLSCALKGTAGEAYNLATGEETTIRELAELLVELSGSTSKLVMTPKRDWDRSGKRYGSTEKAEKQLGFKAKTPIREGLAKTIAWTKENLPRIESCMAKHADRLRALETAKSAPVEAPQPTA